jgi:hypothetical protein
MARWGKLGTVICASVALVATAGTASAELITFEVIPAFAPKGPESPSWSNYVLNALGGIQQNQDVGDRTMTPAAYERVDSIIPASEIVYTPFNSWRGVADPNPLAPAFANELGNRVHFGLHVVTSADAPFALADLGWSLDSDDATDYFDQSGDFSAATYSQTRVGINYGPDGVKGGVDDMWFNSGQPGTMPVNELIYVGVGDGFLSDEPGALTDQDDINMTLADIYAGCGDPTGCLVDLVGSYTLPDSSGLNTASATVTISLVPEPASGVTWLLGMLLSVGGLRHRRTC